MNTPGRSRPELPEDPAAADHLGTDRKEVGDRQGSAKHPPHVTPNEEDAEIQDDHPSPTDVPVLPANATGKDMSTPSEQSEPIDDRSMYNGRPERDKDRPPSRRATDG
jgi:hypothetical protein